MMDNTKTSQNIIKATNISKSYSPKKDENTVLSGINFELLAGEYVSITGPSGSGKSTLLHILGGLDRPSSGNVEIDGVSIGQLNGKELSRVRNKKVGFVFQSYYLQPHLTVIQNIELPRMFNRSPGDKYPYSAESIMDRLGMLELANRKISSLSGGQLQRVAVLRAIINAPKVVLADEPTGNLDEQNTVKVLELLNKVRQEFGIAIVIATHDERVMSYSDRNLTVQSLGAQE